MRKEEGIWGKATRLVVGKAVKDEGKGYFTVKGDTDNYTVRMVGGEISCSCRYWALHGCTKGKLCSHILSVIIWKARQKHI